MSLVYFRKLETQPLALKDRDVVVKVTVFKEGSGEAHVETIEIIFSHVRGTKEATVTPRIKIEEKGGVDLTDLRSILGQTETMDKQLATDAGFVQTWGYVGLFNNAVKISFDRSSWGSVELDLADAATLSDFLETTVKSALALPSPVFLDSALPNS